jgi:multidrug efflux pump subunit AcrA (membrane-fusion protein)
MHLNALLFGVICFAVAQQPADLPNTVTLDGCSINLNDQVEVPAQEGGVIKKIFVKEGQKVKQDEPLVQIDDSIPQQQVNVAEAEFNAAKEQAENKVPRKYAVASLKVAQAELEVNLEANRRVKGTVPQVNINKLELECKQMELSIEKADTDIHIAIKQMDVKKAQLDAAEVSMGHRLLTSSLNGDVREVKRHVGEWVQPGETVVHVVQMNLLRTDGLLKASEYTPAEVVNRPVTVEVQLARLRTEKFQGHIVFVDPMIRPNGAYVVRAEIENREENGQWLLRPGMTAKMTIKLK